MQCTWLCIRECIKERVSPSCQSSIVVQDAQLYWQACRPWVPCMLSGLRAYLFLHSSSALMASSSVTSGHTSWISATCIVMLQPVGVRLKQHTEWCADGRLGCAMWLSARAVRSSLVTLRWVSRLWYSLNMLCCSCTCSCQAQRITTPLLCRRWPPPSSLVRL